jgi:hypothetical protein
MDRKLPGGHDVREGAFDSDVFDSSAFDVGELVIHLSQAEADALDAASMSVADLGRCGLRLLAART